MTLWTLINTSFYRKFLFEWCITWVKESLSWRKLLMSALSPCLQRPPSPHQNTCKMLMCILLQILAAFSSLQTSSGMFSARCSGVEQVQVTSALSLANGSGNPFRPRRASFLKVKAFLHSNPLNKPPAWATCPQAGMSQTSCPLPKI